MTAAEQIIRIDQQINVVRWELHIRVPLINPLSAASWQAAWDKHPDLRAKEDDLFRQRWEAQDAIDAEAVRAAKSAARKERAAYRRKTMIIEWRSNAGRIHTRRVDIGHVRADCNLGALAVLNVGMRGEVVSFHAIAA